MCGCESWPSSLTSLTMPLGGVVELVLLEHARLAVVARLPHLVPRVLVAQARLALIMRQLALDEQRTHLLLAEPCLAAEPKQRFTLQHLRKVRRGDARKDARAVQRPLRRLHRTPRGRLLGLQRLHDS